MVRPIDERTNITLSPLHYRGAPLQAYTPEGGAPGAVVYLPRFVSNGSFWTVIQEGAIYRIQNETTNNFLAANPANTEVVLSVATFDWTINEVIGKAGYYNVSYVSNGVNYYITAGDTIAGPDRFRVVVAEAANANNHDGLNRQAWAFQKAFPFDAA